MNLPIKGLEAYTRHASKYLPNIEASTMGASQDTSTAIQDAMRNAQYRHLNIDTNRSTLDRVFSPLLAFNYASAGFARGMVNDEFSPIKGMLDGFKAGNPFGEGYRKGQHSYSDVIEDAGWKPTSFAGKATKGTLGFLLDVVLDPTTYISGGGTAVIKGTGRTAQVAKQLTKVADELPVQVYENTLAKYQGTNVNPQLAERLAMKKADDIQKQLASGVTHMTDDMAEAIVQNHAVKKGRAITPDELATDAKNLATQYNKMVGIRDVNPQAVTIGMENLPLVGKKLASKMGVLGKTVHLSDGEKLRKVSDKFLISAGYSKLRNSIYGSRLGELFSTKTGAYRLAKEDPAKLYELLHFQTVTQGLTKEKHAMEQAFREKAQLLGIKDPSEQAEIMKLLQDKTIMGKVKSTIKFAETAKAKEIKKIMENAQINTQNELDRLLDNKKITEQMLHATEMDVIKNKNLYTQMQKRMHDDLKKIDINGIEDAKKRSEVINTLREEITSLDDQIAKIQDASKFDVEGFTKLVDETLGESKVRDEFHKGIDDLRAQRVNMETLQGLERAEGKLHNDTINKQIHEMRDQVPKNTNKIKLMDTMSEYVFGSSGKLSYNLQGKALDDLVNMMKKGESGENILWHIEQHPQMYSGHFKQVASYISEALNYKSLIKSGDDVSWENVYHKPMKKIQEKINKNPQLRPDEVLSPDEMQQLFKLNDLKLERLNLINKYFNKMNPEQFAEYLSNQQTEKLIKELHDEINPRLNTHEKIGLDVEANRSKFLDDQSAGTKFKPIGEKEVLKINDILTADTYGRMYEDVATHYLNTMSKRAGKNLSDKKNVLMGDHAHEYASKITTEMFGLLKQNFGNRRYNELTRGQQALLLDMAHKKMFPTKKMKELEKIGKSQQAIALQKEAERRAGLERLQALEAYTKEGSEVLFFANERPYRGIVTSKVFDDLQGTQLTVRTFDDEVVNVPLRNVKKVNQNSTMKSVDEVISGNKTINQAVQDREKVIETLTKQINEYNSMGNVVSESKKRTMDAYTTRLKEQLGMIKKYEHEKRFFEKKLEKMTDVEFHVINKRLKEYEDALSSDEAFETWLRTHSKADVWKMRNPQRYERGIKYVDASKMPKGWVAETGEFGRIRVTNGEIDKQAVKNNFHYFKEELIKLGWTPERITKVFKDKPEKIKQFILEHELSHRYNKDWKKTNRGGDFSDPETRKIELRANHDALKAIENFPETVEVMVNGFKKGFGSNEAIEQVVMDLRKEFMKMGDLEVTIGKMKKDQFKAMMYQYLPRHITEDGLHLLAKNKELTQKGSALSRDIGYGQKYNPYSKERTMMTDKTIQEINDSFRDLLKGKNFFSDTLSDIYLQRALKYTELMYDDKYMNEMMDMFGSTIVDGKVREGYKAVANIGLLKKQVEKLTKAQLQDAHQKGMTITDDMWEKARLKSMDLLGLKSRDLDELATPMVELSQSQIKKIANVNPNLAKEVNDVIVQKANQARKLQIERDQSQFLSMYDKFLHWTKLMQTTVMPAFHIRNKISNTYLNWLGVGADAVNPQMQYSAGVTALHRGNSSKLGKLHDVATPSGKVYKWDELYALAIQHNVIDEGFFAKDIGAGAQTKGLLRGKVKPQLDPTNTGSFVAFRQGAEWGGRIENQDRLIHFVSALRQGKTVQEASESSRKFLFDYSDVTAFEGRVMKRLIPYYTWLRKNGRLMVGEMIEQPGKFRDSGKVMNGINNMNNQEDRMNPAFTDDFAEDWVQLPISFQGRPIIANPFMPFMDVNRFPLPHNPGRAFKDTFAQMSPQIKVPLELMANKNVFFGNDIQKEGQNPITPRLQHVLNQLAPYNVASGIARKEGMDKAMYAMSNLTGVKHMAYDYDSSRSRVLDEAKAQQLNPEQGMVADVAQNIMSGFSGLVSKAVSDKPLRADEYTDALRPISQARYESLSEKEKEQYAPPTEQEAFAYHKKAKELEEQAYQEAGVMKRFTWALINKFGNVPDTEIGLVTDVIDGDTVKVKIGNQEPQSVRFLLVDTPETVHYDGRDPEPFGKEASQFTKGALLDKDVRLVFEGKRTDKYDRLVAYIELDGEDVNKSLVEQGLGKTRYTYPDFPNKGTQYSRTAEYFEAERKASQEKRGLWSLDGYSTPGVDTGFNPEAIKRWLARQ